MKHKNIGICKDNKPKTRQILKISDILNLILKYDRVLFPHPVYE